MLSLIFFAFFAGCTVALPCSETNCTVTAVAVDNGSGAMIGFDSSRHLCADRGAFLVTPVDNGTMAAVFKVCNTSFLGFRQNGSQPQTLCDWRDVDEPDFAVPFQSPFWNSYSNGNFEPNAGMGHLRNKDVFDCSTVTNNGTFAHKSTALARAATQCGAILQAVLTTDRAMAEITFEPPALHVQFQKAICFRRRL